MAEAQVVCHACAVGLRDVTADGLGPCPVCGEEWVWPLFGRCLYWRLEGHTPVPVDEVLTWGRWCETADRTVARTAVAPGVEVLTLFLGIDHGWGAGPPLLFETMVCRDGEAGDAMERYSTWTQAEQGHQRIVEALRATLGRADAAPL
jgi:predicted RNA-binding Zn-ribbon protein involved in translation (DUF1610 family)